MSQYRDERLWRGGGTEVKKQQIYFSSIRYPKCFEKLKYIIFHDGENYLIIFLTLRSEIGHPVYGMHFF